MSPQASSYSDTTPQTQVAGFTLLELIVVLVLIAILILLILAVRPSARKTAQDNTRKADVQKIAIAIESYAGDKECYPPPATLSQCGSNALDPYLAKIPCDPGTDKPYFYVRSSDCLSYAIYTTLERENDPASAAVGCEAGCGPDLNGDGTPDFSYGKSSGGMELGELVENVEVSPTCENGFGQFRCIAGGSDGSCCPGALYRCNATGDACIPVAQ